MAASAEQDSSTSTKLAIERTRLAHERTLMAWVRTATSLISFGFTIYKFFEYLRESQGAPTSSAHRPTRVRGADDWNRYHGNDPRDHRTPPQHACVAYRIRSAHPLLACHRRGRPDWDPGRHSARRRLVPNVETRSGAIDDHSVQLAGFAIPSALSNGSGSVDRCTTQSRPQYRDQFVVDEDCLGFEPLGHQKRYGPFS